VKTSSLDPALFYLHNGAELAGVICLHVDDFFWGGTKLMANVVSQLRNIFFVGGSESGSFKYVGLNIDASDDGSISLDQFGYCSGLKKASLSHKRMSEKTSDLLDEEKHQYRSMVGQLNWISTQTRPDISFDVCDLSTKFSQTKVGDMIRANKVVQRVKTDNIKIVYPKLDNLSECCFECYSDASFANLDGGGSQGGHVIFLSDRKNKCPVSWQSRKLRRVVKSTLAAETLALLDCAEAAVYLASILSEVMGKPKMKIQCYVDNKSLVDALYSSKMVDDRRLRLDVAVLQDMMARHEVESVSWVSTSAQLANCLTKRGASSTGLIASIGGQS
jgi:hypothetical protein